MMSRQFRVGQALSVMSTIRFRCAFALMLTILCMPGVSSGDNVGLAGHAVKSLAIDPTTPATLYAGLANGFVAKSVNGGADWTLVDTGQTTQDIGVLAIFTEVPFILYASDFSAGFTVAASIDGGATWGNPTEGCGAPGETCSALGFTDIAIAPNATVYAGARSGQVGTGTGVGVFKSTDGGVYWMPTTMPGFLKVYLAIDPVSASTIYATGWGGGVYKSVNSGGTWTAMNEGLGSLNNNALVIDPATPSTLYVGSSGGSVYKSTNGGGSWTAMNQGLAIGVINCMAIDPKTPTTLYVGGSAFGSIYKTTDGGANWSSSNVGMDENRYNIITGLVVDPVRPSTVYAATYNGVYKSDDSGATWVHPPPASPSLSSPDADATANFRHASTDGDPINTFTGELFSRKPADLDLGGPMPLYFQRYYASYLRRSFVVGDLGSNWRHNFDSRLFWSGNTITYVTHDGRVTKFLQDLGTGNWTQLTNTDTPYQLSATGGADVVLYDPEDARIYTFDFTTSSVIIGKLVQIEDGHGNVHTVTYDLATGQIQTVSDGLGRTLAFTYNTDSIPKISVISDGTRSISFEYTDPIDTEYLTLATDGLLGVTEYTYEDTSANADHALMTGTVRPLGNMPYGQTFFDTDNQFASGRVASQTDADGNTFSFDYSGPDTTLTDPLGNTRVHTHTSTGEFTNRQDETGQSFSMGSDATGRRNAITDRLGATTTYDYDEASGNISTVTDADGGTSDFSYTPRAFGTLTLYDLTTITYADGTTEHFGYDAMGNVTSHTDQDGNTTTTTYNAHGQPLVTTNAAGGTTTNTYNADGTLLTTTDPAGNTTTFGYDALRRVNLMTFADGTTQRFTYNDHDHLLTPTDGDNRTTTLAYDANGNLAIATDPLNNNTSFDYDGNDRPISTIDPLGNAVDRSYGPLGKIATVTDENGNITTFDYDILGRHISTTDPLGHVWSQTYDAEAILSSRTDPLGNTTTFVSDSMGRITDTTSPLGNSSSVSYDVMGRLASTTDPLGNTTTFSRDARGLLSGVTLPDVTIGASYARNALASITTITDPNGNIWQRDYDSGGRPISSSDPLGNTVNTAYDNRERPAVVSFPAAMGMLTMTYDDAGNRTRSAYSGGPTLDYTYDNNDRLTEANGVTWSYDADGRIANTNGIAIIRDPGGRVTSMTLAPGKSVTYTYDANNRLTQVTDWVGGVTTFSYDAAGRQTGIVRPNGVNTAKTWDADSRLTSITEGAISAITLTRDAKGQVTVADRDVPLPVSSAGPTSASYMYDAASQVSGFTYDGLGRLTDDGDRTYAWDLASRLTGITEGGTTTTFTYDALGHRLSRTANGTSRNYIWNLVLDLPSISVETQSGADLRYFVHTPAGALLYAIDATSNARSFYHFDEMGNTLFVTDEGGTVVKSYAHTPYGKLIAATGGLDDPFTWQGEFGIMDEGNGLYYIRARYYDSATARFISRDPIGAIDPQRLNPYQYALENPLRFQDHSGLTEIPDIGLPEGPILRGVTAEPPPRPEPKFDPLNEAVNDAERHFDRVREDVNTSTDDIIRARLDAEEALSKRLLLERLNPGDDEIVTFKDPRTGEVRVVKVPKAQARGRLGRELANARARQHAAEARLRAAEARLRDAFDRVNRARAALDARDESRAALETIASIFIIDSNREANELHGRIGGDGITSPRALGPEEIPQ